MRELFLETLELVDEAGLPRRYDYSILIGEMDVGRFSCESYGVKVAQRGGPSASVPNITCNVGRIDELSRLLLDNQVTPAALEDVVQDWL